MNIKVASMDDDRFIESVRVHLRRFMQHALDMTAVKAPTAGR
jgi:hypothetical protein